MGSSPLARGLLAVAMSVLLLVRIIPARAGFTEAYRQPAMNVGDHPRSRGVYLSTNHLAFPGNGSSPLARGLLWRRPCRVGTRRIIPARAGFTAWPRLRSSLSGDHPRSRGVYGGAARGRCLGPGSSPLARGLHLRPARPLRHGGIIPARAGFTCRPRRGRLGGGDHPRSRGVYCDHETKMAAVPGSSPLARGLRIHRSVRNRRHRIIPARAGFTPVMTAPACGLSDHPRSRGVYAPGTASANWLKGSSPLARGLRRARL